jgi:hypothetical protein
MVCTHGFVPSLNYDFRWMDPVPLNPLTVWILRVHQEYAISRMYCFCFGRVGKKAPKSDRSSAIKVLLSFEPFLLHLATDGMLDRSVLTRYGWSQAGMQFSSSHSRKTSTPIQRIVESGETPIFTDYFSDWPRPKQVGLEFRIQHLLQSLADFFKLICPGKKQSLLLSQEAILRHLTFRAGLQKPIDFSKHPASLSQIASGPQTRTGSEIMAALEDHQMARDDQVSIMPGEKN